MTDDRLSRDEYYLGIARAVAARGTCTRAKVGAIVVVGDVVAATGYNGAPRGTRHCDHGARCDVCGQPEPRSVLDMPHRLTCRRQRDLEEGGYVPGDMENGHCSRAVHSETNVIANAARTGTSILGGTMYVTATPCYRCAPLIIQVGIVRILAGAEYRQDERAMNLFTEAGVEVEYLDAAVPK